MFYRNCSSTGQSKELIVKEDPAPKEEAKMEEDKLASAEWEEEKAKEEPKVEEKAQQPEILLLASAPDYDYCIFITLNSNICDGFQAKRFYGWYSNGLWWD